VDDDPSEVDWLAIEDEAEQADRLAGKKPMVAPSKKRGQTSKTTSSAEGPRQIVDLEEAEDPANKRRRLIADWPEEEDEEVEEAAGLKISSRRERLARRQEPSPPLQSTGATPRPPQAQVQPPEAGRPTAAAGSGVTGPTPTTGTVTEKGARAEKVKKSQFSTVFRSTDL
jgi:hypothetical protein